MVAVPVFTLTSYQRIPSSSERRTPVVAANVHMAWCAWDSVALRNRRRSCSLHVVMLRRRDAATTLAGGGPASAGGHPKSLQLQFRCCHTFGVRQAAAASAIVSTWTKRGSPLGLNVQTVYPLASAVGPSDSIFPFEMKRT